MLRRSRADAWPFGVSNAAIRYRVADVRSTSVDAFDCGSDWWAEEINDFVRSRHWSDPPWVALEFGLKGESVGFAFLILAKKPHPDASSGVKAMYELIVMVGIHTDFQHTEDPKAPKVPGRDRRENLSVTMFRGIEEFARSRPEKPVGLWLQVRVENQHAIRFYRQFGFTKDEVKGEFVSTDKAHVPTIEMRKPL